MGDRPAPDLFTALSLEPARATPPIDRDAAAADPRAGAPAPVEQVATAPVSPIEPEGPTRVVEPAALEAEREVAAKSAVASGIPPSPFGGSRPIAAPMPPPPPAPVAVPVPPPERTRAPQRTEVVPTVPAQVASARGGRVPPPPTAAARPPAPIDRGGLADLLEPPGGQPVAGLDELVAEMSRDLSTSGAAHPLVALDDPRSYPAPGTSGISPAVAPSIPPSPVWDEPAPRGRGIAWIFVPVSLVLAGTLGWVLYTQTDLFAGDLVARRDAEAQAEVQAEQQRAQEAAEATKKERGTFTLTSEPSKARVWMVQPGPDATFPGLPIDGEYMVAVTAPGHQPRVRVVKGSELVAPVVVDLDPLAPEADPAPEIPPAPVPKVGRETNKTTELVLRSNTPGAELMLLVGYTPGATVVDLDVRETHRFLVTLEGHEPHAIEIKGRHWEERDGGELSYDDTVTLVPRVAPNKGSMPPAQHEGEAQPEK